MKPNLVIVESPAKAKTIEKYLGKTFSVMASIGHLVDLPAKRLGVDVKDGFMPEYEIIPGKKKVVDGIKKAAKEAENVYLAPDPDREGEAIAWHVAEIVKKLKNPPVIHRVLFNEITKKAILEAMKKTTKLDQNMFDAQQARRILDRLVGYQISPILWEKVRRGLSAGRVQSVAVRLVCEREEEIQKFNSEEYWYLEARLEGSKPPPFIARLSKKAGVKAEIKSKAESEKLLKELEKASFVLGAIQKREVHRNPAPPFITSKLQQEAARKLGFSAKKTMVLAQKLYEGVEVTGGELIGLITYMRTDSTRSADSAIAEARAHIQKTFGKNYLPDSPNIYKSKKGAQDAHEAIRPTSMEYTPDQIESFLQKDELRLYDLIWKRFIASQMNPAVLDGTTFVIQAKNYEFRAAGSVIKFPGFIAIYTEDLDEGVAPLEEGEEGRLLPALKEGEKLKLHEFIPSQHFTQPPPRFTEASLVKELEEKGIGRPSTYASILSVIQDKKYVEKLEKKFRPTDLGTLVNGLLVKNFPDILNVAFTAEMEGNLDSVEEGTKKWKDALKEFYTPFSKALKKAKDQMRDVKKQEVLTDKICEKCSSPMVIKFGRHGEFLACSKYPDCKNTKEFRRDDKGVIQIEVVPDTGQVCEKCGKPMIIKRGRFGSFMACSGYPECKNAKSISIGVNCPLCQKPVSARKSKKGRLFYGCTGYPTCTFAAWDKPVNKKCPDCGSAYLVEKQSKGKGTEIKCPEKTCNYEDVGAGSKPAPAEKPAQ